MRPGGRPRALVAGGGIGGLAAGLACARAGFEVRVLERAAALSGVGAGIQLGPNATRVLHGWRLDAALAAVASFPDRLRVHHAHSGAELGALELGPRALRRYGAPYATVHRADLQQLLCDALRLEPRVQLDLGRSIDTFSEDEAGVAVRTNESADVLRGDLLIGADGLWSLVRERLLADGPPRATGHLAYRALVRQTDLPASVRGGDVNVWLGRRLHVVAYPVRGGEWLNLVVIVHRPRAWTGTDPRSWDEAADAGDLLAALAGCCRSLQTLVRAVPSWRLWMLFDRPPMRSRAEHGSGRVLLIGDAAHPMRPYLAQGAGMAIEDAALLELLFGGAHAADIAPRVQRFAQARWQRNARVQARALRNGRIFHAAGPVALARDAALKVLGARLLDVPWLYEFSGAAV